MCFGPRLNLHSAPFVNSLEAATSCYTPRDLRSSDYGGYPTTPIMSLQLPPSLNLPPHLSAHKYIFICTLTVAAWDTIVLSPRTWRLMKMKEWPILKVLFYFLRIFMPVEFTIVAVAFFDMRWTQASCSKFFLFEPICTAILLAAASAVHLARVYAIYDKNRAILFSLGALFGVQVAVTGIACGFYRSVPLLVGQGCIAGPKYTWVGMYWVAPTALYTATFVLALLRSIDSRRIKPLTPWKLMLRDGLNLYGAICIVQLVNVFFWFLVKPTGPSDSIRTIVTSMTTVITSSMTLRIILSIRGTLTSGGTYAGSSISTSSSSRTTHVLSTNRPLPGTPTYTLDEVRTGGKEMWVEADGDASLNDGKDSDDVLNVSPQGVKITVRKEIRPA